MRTCLILFPVALLLAVLCSVPAAVAVSGPLYVSPLGNNQLDGSSPGTALLDVATAQARLGAAGGSVVMLPGSYGGSNNTMLVFEAPVQVSALLNGSVQIHCNPSQYGFEWRNSGGLVGVNLLSCQRALVATGGDVRIDGVLVSGTDTALQFGQPSGNPVLSSLQVHNSTFERTSDNAINLQRFDDLQPDGLAVLLNQVRVTHTSKGALYMSTQRVTVNNSLLRSDPFITAGTAQFSFIRLNGNAGTLTLQNSSVESATLNQGGGIVYLTGDENSRMWLVNSRFAHNSIPQSFQSSALFEAYRGSVLIANCIFEQNNLANSYVIEASPYSTINMYSTRFDSNRFSDNAPAMIGCDTSGNVVMFSSEFSNNTTPGGKQVPQTHGCQV